MAAVTAAVIGATATLAATGASIASRKVHLVEAGEGVAALARSQWRRTRRTKQ